MSEQPHIVVVGSCMMDFVSYAPHLPRPGETLHGTKFVTNFGGKGANQCVAAAKLGAKTTLIARVGDDLWGDQYIEHLKNQRVGAQSVKKTPGQSTGVAQINVADCGANQIVVVAGANGFLTPQDLNDNRLVIQKADVLVLQLETPLEVALKSLSLCQGTSILNGAPAIQKYGDLLTLPTFFCCNEVEASIFTGLPVTTDLEAEAAARDLISKGCQSVILTLGAQGALYLSRSGEFCRVASPKVRCVDSTGAGDSFIGAFAYLWCHHRSLGIERILEAACFAAADSVTRPGTQSSFPEGDVLAPFVEGLGDKKMG